MIRKIALTVLAAVMALSLIGCSTNEGTENILTVGDRELGAGIYIGYMLDTYTTASYSANADDFWGSTIEEKNIEDYIRDTALDSVKRHIAVDMLYDEMGLELTEEMEYAIDADAASFLGYVGDIYLENGCGEESVKSILAIEYKIGDIFRSLYYEDGTEAVSEEEKTEYYEENYAEYRVMTFLYSDSTNAPHTEEKKEEIDEMAEGYLERARGDEDFDDLAAEATEELAEFNGIEDFVEYDEENAYKVIKPESTNFEEDMIKAIFDSEELVSEIYYGESAVYVFQRNSIDRDPDTREGLEGDIISSLRADEFETKLEEYEASLDIVINEAATERYSPRNIK